jgi:hypothetical protein
MARTKAYKGPNSFDRRTTWTRFHLPRGQEWPTWSVVYSDPHRGPLTDVEGIDEVWLGRTVEDSEQAALIICGFSGTINFLASINDLGA